MSKELSNVQKQAKRIRGKEIFTPLPKNDTVDKIIANYLEGYELSPKEEELQDRYYELWSALTSGTSPEIAKQAYAEKHGLSMRQVFRDMKDAMRVHGEIQPPNKAAFRHVLYELSMMVFTKAMNENPPNLKQMNASIANMIKIYGIDKEDPEKVDWDKLESHTIKIQMPKHIRQFMESQLKKGRIDIDDLVDVKDLNQDEDGVYQEEA